ncbi:hypothetical protein [Geomonas sp.]|uniref:phenylacetate--CoA ligase family protein n=1 Tax=Geomonas sp. TaxID=2651584 RepID=UPI002B46DB11|nr:hypothetical protein [Geomonas sp.]HJV36214.1 hypothetical protein [Geomonas sp.]
MHPLLSKYLVWTPTLLLRGENIRPLMRAYAESQYLDRGILEKAQLESFKQVVEYAYQQVPFYREKYQRAGFTPDQLRLPEDVRRVPLLTKEEVKRADLSSGSYRGMRFRRSTSGSTGQPLVYYKDPESMRHMDAILYRDYSWYGVDVGFRQARFWGLPPAGASRYTTQAIDLLLNRVRISPFELEEKKYLGFLETLQRFRPQYIYGYAQSIYQFCHYFHLRGIDLSGLGVGCVIVTSEMIFPSQLRVISEVLGCRTPQEYGCTEVGIIGFECPMGSMHLMENLLVETVPAEEGEGDNIVVSELNGRLFPFIRYQIGDRGAISDRRCGCGRELKVLEQLTGRKDDFIRCREGKLVDAYLVEYLVSGMPGRLGTVHQFKMVQTEMTSLRLMMVASGNRDGIRGYLCGKLAEIVGPGMVIDLEFVPSIAREKSGKLRFFSCEIPDPEGGGAP